MPLSSAKIVLILWLCPIWSMGLVYLSTWMVDLYGKCQCRRIYNPWLLRVFSKVSLVSEIVLLWKLTCSLKHDGWKTRSLFRVHVILHHWQLLLNPLKKQVGLTSSHLISLHLSSDTKRQKDTKTSTNASTHIIWFYQTFIDLNLSHRIHVGYMKSCFCQDKRR